MVKRKAFAPERIDLVLEVVEGTMNDNSHEITIEPTHPIIVSKSRCDNGREWRARTVMRMIQRDDRVMRRRPDQRRKSSYFEAFLDK